MTIHSAKVTHLFHSGFIVETKTHTLVFDYYDPKSNEKLSSIKLLSEDYFKDRSNVFVFVSHSHFDHYTPEIFEWEKVNPNINYILSNDIKINRPKSNYHFISKYKSLNLNNLEIRTYGTTDRGLSFFVSVDNLGIFHAGDLNWWHWKNDSPIVQAKEEKDFKQEVQKIKEENIDIAFVPVDPRLEEYYYLAGEYYARTLTPRLIVPMHFGENFYITKNFQKQISSLNISTIVLKNINQSFTYERNNS